MGPDKLKVEETETETEDRSPPTLRDSIRSAMTEVNSREDEDGDKELKTASDKEDKIEKEDIEELEVSDDKDTKKASKKESKEPEEPNEELKASETDDEDKKVSEAKEPKQKAIDSQAPASLPKEVTDNWSKIPSNVQGFIAKSHKELSDTKATLGRVQAHYRDLDAAIAPYRQQIQQFGVSEAQTVGRLFEWMDALTGQHKYVAFQQLAQNFGIDINQYHQQQDGGDYSPQQQQQQQQQFANNPEIDNRIAALEQSINQQDEANRRARAVAAEQSVNNWAGLTIDAAGVPYYKNKPHFDKVRVLMKTLLAGGTIPLVNGQLDLDSAYDQACNAHPEVRAQLTQEIEAKKEQERQEKIKKQRERNLAEARKAKSTGSLSLKPNAPVGGISTPNKKPNGPISVRDSVRSAVEEVGRNN